MEQNRNKAEMKLHAKKDTIYPYMQRIFTERYLPVVLFTFCVLQAGNVVQIGSTASSRTRTANIEPKRDG